MKVLIFILFPFFCLSQVQIGNTIYGLGGAYDTFGGHIAMSDNGSIIAVAASGETGFDHYKGRIRVYNNLNGNWTQIGNPIVGNDFDYFGTGISLSSDGNILAVGTGKFNPTDGAFNQFGYVKIFQNLNNNWVQIGNTITDEDDNTYFGSNISLSANGNTIVISAPYYSGSASRIGKVAVFQNINNNWVQIGDTIYGSNQGDGFGMNVSLSSDGTILAVGAPGNIGSGVNPSYVKVFLNSNNNWTQIGNNIDFGNTLDLSGDGNTIAVSTTNYSGGYGKARIYGNVGGNWTQIGADINSSHIWDLLGQSLSLSYDGSILALGSSWYGQGSSRYGRVSLYKNQNQNWEHRTDVMGLVYDNNLGESTALSSNGFIVSVGIPGSKGIFNQPFAGEAKVFDLSQALSTNTLTLYNLRIYPNPVSEVLNIELSENIKFEKATIYNSLGQLIKTANKKVINVNDLAKGTYHLMVTTNQGETTKSFIIE